MDSEGAGRLGVDISAMLNVVIIDWRSTHSISNVEDGDHQSDPPLGGEHSPLFMQGSLCG